ncbi:MAG: hypothetical protein AB7Q37_04425 [Pyrinomonadaceae bacterium]
MKRCPECRRDYYDDTLLYCLDDGNPLLEGPASGSSRGDEPATALLHDTDSRSEAATRAQITTTDDTAVLPAGWADGRKTGRFSKRGPLVLFAVGLVAFGGLGYGLYQFLESQENVPPNSANTLKSRRLTGDGKTRQAVISPDGKFLAFRTGNTLRVKQIETNSEVEVIPSGEFPDGMGGFIFSPDGNFIYLEGRKEGNTERSIYRTPTLGGRTEKIISDGWGASFSPDGQQFAFARGNADGIEQAYFIANKDGSQEQKVVSLRDKSKFFAMSPSWSPDGKFLAAGIGDDSLNPKPKFIPVTISIADGTFDPLGERYFTSWGDIRWHPDGQTLYFVGSETTGALQIWEFQYPTGTSRALTQSIDNYYGLSITADGNSIATIQSRPTSSIWVSPDTDPANAKQVMPDSFNTFGLSWTPDGRIVYASNQSGDAEIWIMDQTGENARQLTNDRKFKSDLSVSLDGRFIAYGGAGGRLYQIGIDGGNPIDLQVNAGSFGFSVDSQWIIYYDWVDPTGFSIFRIPTGGGSAVRLTDYVAMAPRYSPDGKYFACKLSDEKAQTWDRIAIVPAEGGAPEKVLELPANSVGHPRWTPDGKGVTYYNNGFWVQPIDGGPPKKLEIPKYRSTGLDDFEYSLDGKQVAFELGETTSNAVLLTDFR